MLNFNHENSLFHMKMHYKFFCNLFLLLVFFTFSSHSQSEQNNNTFNNYYETYPKASDDATVIYKLQSNLERTHFFVDGKELGIGKQLMIRINNQGHTFTAKPENCIKSQEEFIQPPFNKEVPLSFTFVTGECDPEELEQKNETIIQNITIHGHTNINTTENH